MSGFTSELLRRIAGGRLSSSNKVGRRVDESAAVSFELTAWRSFTARLWFVILDPAHADRVALEPTIWFFSKETFMRFTRTVELGFAAALLCAASAHADVVSSSLALQTTSPAFRPDAATNMDLAAARPDVSLSSNGFSFGPKANRSTPIAATQSFMGPPRQLAYYGAAIFNYFMTPQADTRAYDNYLLITYPGYAVSTWTDRVVGAPSTGVGSPTDLWTAGVYYMARTHPLSAPSEHPVLSVMPKFGAHHELDGHSVFQPPR